MTTSAALKFPPKSITVCRGEAVATELTYDGGYNHLFSKKTSCYEELVTLPVNGANRGGDSPPRASQLTASRRRRRQGRGPEAASGLLHSGGRRGRAFRAHRSAVASTWVDKNAHLLPLYALGKLVVNW
jgi:hypothetical protein